MSLIDKNWNLLACFEFVESGRDLDCGPIAVAFAVVPEGREGCRSRVLAVHLHVWVCESLALRAMLCGSCGLQ